MTSIVGTNIKTLYSEGRAIAEMVYPRVIAYRQVPCLIRDRLVRRGAALTEQRLLRRLDPFVSALFGTIAR